MWYYNGMETPIQTHVSKIDALTANVMNLMDCGLDRAQALEITLAGTLLPKQYHQLVKDNVADYVHLHRYVRDVMTGRMWCATCQQFADGKVG